MVGKMKLDDSIDAILDGLKRTPQQLEAWKTLKKELKKRNLSGYDREIHRVGISEAENVLAVLMKASDRFKYGKMDAETDGAGGSKTQFSRIIKLSKSGGDVMGMLDILADQNYSINSSTGSGKTFLDESDLKIFQELLKDDLFKKYSRVFKALKKGLGYKYEDIPGCIYYTQVWKIIELSKLDEDVCGAIYILADKDNHVNKIEKGLTLQDMEGIKEITKLLYKEEQEPSTTVCAYLYKKGSSEIFKKFFSDLESEKQKNALETLFNCEERNEEIEEWLNTQYLDIVREAGQS